MLINMILTLRVFFLAFWELKVAENNKKRYSRESSGLSIQDTWI